MKRNAIARIILWAVTLVVLIGLLCAAMLWFQPLGRYEVPNHSASEVTPTPEKLTDSAGSRTASEFPRDIQEIEIDWLSGNIRLLPANVDRIQVSETPVADAKYAIVCKQEGQTLKVEYCQHTALRNLNGALSKDLTIVVPNDWEGRALKVDAASAKLFVQDLTIREVEIDNASGAIQFNNCTVEELDIDTASGDIRFTGSLNKLDCDSASASVYAELDNVPTEIDMDTASGAVELILPRDAGFSLKSDSLSGSFDSDFPFTVKNGRYVSGDGACKIDMSSMSGGVTIRSK